MKKLEQDKRRRRLEDKRSRRLEEKWRRRRNGGEQRRKRERLKNGNFMLSLRRDFALIFFFLKKYSDVEKKINAF